jgi:transposase
MCKTVFENVQKDNQKLLKNIQKNICDGGYDGKEFKKMMKSEFDLEIEITQRTDIKNGIVSKIRWVVERSFAWLDKCRRLSKNYEGTFRSTKSMIVMAFVRLLCRRLTGGCTLKWIKRKI